GPEQAGDVQTRWEQAPKGVKYGRGDDVLAMGGASVGRGASEPSALRNRDSPAGRMVGAARLRPRCRGAWVRFGLVPGSSRVESRLLRDAGRGRGRDR